MALLPLLDLLNGRPVRKRSTYGYSPNPWKFGSTGQRKKARHNGRIAYTWLAKSPLTWRDLPNSERLVIKLLASAKIKLILPLKSR